MFITKDILSNEKFKVLNLIVDKLKSIFRSLSYKHDELKQYAKINSQSNFLNVIETIFNMKSLIDFDVLMTNNYHQNYHPILQVWKTVFAHDGIQYLECWDHLLIIQQQLMLR